MRKECTSLGIIPDPCSSHDVSCSEPRRDENTGADETDEAASNEDKHPRGSSNVRHCIFIVLIVPYFGYYLSLTATEAHELGVGRKCIRIVLR
jgi:hypothetical protein